MKETDIISLYLRPMDKSRVSAPGEPVWRPIRGSKGNGTRRVISLEDPPDELKIYPGTRKHFIILKEFIAPYPEIYDDSFPLALGAEAPKRIFRDYYEVHSLQEIFAEIRKQMDNGLYRLPALPTFKRLIEMDRMKQLLDSNDEKKNIAVLHFFLTYYTEDFLLSELIAIKSLRKRFAGIINNYKHSQEWKRAKNTLEKLIMDRPSGMKSSKKLLPPYLYLGGMREYLLKRAKYRAREFSDWLNGKNVSEPKDIKKELPGCDSSRPIRNYAQLLDRQIAKFLGLTPGGLKAQLIEERKLIMNPEKPKRTQAHLVLKIPPRIN